MEKEGGADIHAIDIVGGVVSNLGHAFRVANYFTLISFQILHSINIPPLAPSASKYSATYM